MRVKRACENEESKVVADEVGVGSVKWPVRGHKETPGVKWVQRHNAL